MSPCTRCEERDRLRSDLLNRVQIHQRETESLFRDVQEASSASLPLFAAEVERLVGVGRGGSR